MPWIEGIGDEVTIGVSIAVTVCVLFIAWLSTGIRDIPFISVIIVQLTRRREVLAGNTTTTSDDSTAATSTVSDNLTTSEAAEESQQREIKPSSTEDITEATAGSSCENAASSTSNETDNEISIVPDAVVPDTAENSQPSTADIPNVTITSSPVERPHAHIVDTGNSIAGSVGITNEHSHTEESNSESEPANVPVTNTELRQRRLDFFSGNSSGKLPCDYQSADRFDDVCNGSDRLRHESVSTSEAKPQSLSQFASNLLSEQLTSADRLIPDSSTDSDAVNASTDQAETQSETGNGTRDSGLETDVIRVKIKFLNDTQRSVTASSTETIGNFRRRHFSTELSESKLVRFIFNGQDLRNDSSTLESYYICDNSVVHCLVTQPPTEQQYDHNGDDNGLDIGIFMFPLFGLLLGMVWYLRFMYRQFFNVTSTLTLAGITFLYIAAFMSTLRGHGNHEHID